MNIDLSQLGAPGEKRILCAVSGGADSMCLLHWLHSHDYSVTAAHFEHGIRKEESERDLNFVRGYCRSRRIAFVYDRGDVPAYARDMGLSTEEAARELRYRFLEEKRQELCLDLIATAHNAEDNAETLLFNLARGSGTHGLKGIDACREHIVRPLLGVSRREICKYLEKYQLSYVEDSTNLSDDYTRNFIRHNILPLMQEINPRFVEAAARTAKLCRQDDEALDRQAREFIALHLRDESLPCIELLRLHGAISSRVLRLEISGLDMGHVDSILDFCRGFGYGELDIPGRRLYRDGGRLWLALKEESVPCPDGWECSLELGKEEYLSPCSMYVKSEIVDYNGEINDLFKTYYLKYEIMSDELRIGSRLPGDRIRPEGRGCTKSLKSLFIEKAYTQKQRNTCPIIRDDDGPLFVYGIAAAERGRPQAGEKAVKFSFLSVQDYFGENRI